MIPWAQPSPNPKRHLDRFNRFFAQLTAESRYTLQQAAPFPLKLPLLMGVSEPHLGRFSRFAWLTSVTDRQTDRPTDHATRSVTIGRIYVRGTAMRPKS